MNRRFIPFAITLSVLILVGACIDTIPKDPAPSGPAVGEGSGLRASYFDASGSRVVSRVDPVLDFDWAYATPDPQLPPDRFSVVWTGEIEFPSSGEYELIMNADDGVRLFIDGSADLFAGTAWIEQGMEMDHVVTRSFSAGRKTIRIEYFENEWNAGSRLSWQGPGIARQIVPKRYLYPGAAVSAPPRGLPFGAEGPSVPAPSPAPAPSPVPAPPAPIDPPPGAQTITYTISDTDFMNPERGWTGERWGSQTFSTKYGQTHINEVGYTMVHEFVNLGAYRTQELPESFLRSIREDFDTIRGSGVKILLRFAYNREPGGEDAPKEWVLRHIEQIGPILREYEDVIATLQGGFIGSWGEWHSSHHGLDTPENRAEIARALLNQAPDSMMVELRTPAQIRDALGLSDDEIERIVDGEQPYTSWFSDDSYARIGLKNDCVMTNENDQGTWNLFPHDRAWHMTRAPYTVTGGENCHEGGLNSWNDCDNTIVQLNNHGWDHLNDEFWEPLLYKWKDQGCFDEISRRLGYRYELREGAYSGTVNRAQNEPLYVALTMHNHGFGKLYNPRPLELVLTNTATGAPHRFLLASDARPVLPISGETVTIAREVDVAAIPAGTYRLYLALPDGSEKLENNHRYSIRLANPSMWVAGDSWDGLNDLGFSVTIT